MFDVCSCLTLTLIAGVAGDKTTVLFSNLVALALHILPLTSAYNPISFFFFKLNSFFGSTSTYAAESHQVALSTFCLELSLPKAKKVH